MCTWIYISDAGCGPRRRRRSVAMAVAKLGAFRRLPPDQSAPVPPRPVLARNVSAVHGGTEGARPGGDIVLSQQYGSRHTAASGQDLCRATQASLRPPQASPEGDREVEVDLDPACVCFSSRPSARSGRNRKKTGRALARSPESNGRRYPGRSVVEIARKPRQRKDCCMLRERSFCLISRPRST